MLRLRAPGQDARVQIGAVLQLLGRLEDAAAGRALHARGVVEDARGGRGRHAGATSHLPQGHAGHLLTRSAGVSTPRGRVTWRDRPGFAAARLMSCKRLIARSICFAQGRCRRIDVQSMKAHTVLNARRRGLATSPALETRRSWRASTDCPAGFGPQSGSGTSRGGSASRSARWTARSTTRQTSSRRRAPASWRPPRRSATDPTSRRATCGRGRQQRIAVHLPDGDSWFMQTLRDGMREGAAPFAPSLALEFRTYASADEQALLLSPARAERQRRADRRTWRFERPSLRGSRSSADSTCRWPRSSTRMPDSPAGAVGVHRRLQRRRPGRRVDGTLSAGPRPRSPSSARRSAAARMPSRCAVSRRVCRC